MRPQHRRTSWTRRYHLIGPTEADIVISMDCSVLTCYPSCPSPVRSSTLDRYVPWAAPPLLLRAVASVVGRHDSLSTDGSRAMPVLTSLVVSHAYGPSFPYTCSCFWAGEAIARSQRRVAKACMAGRITASQEVVLSAALRVEKEVSRDLEVELKLIASSSLRHQP